MKLYPFFKQSDTANVFVMVAFRSTSISARVSPKLGGATVIGPMLVGLSHPVQIDGMGARYRDPSTWRCYRRTT
jgi:malate dehydrogenase (oxaloacetate-decarboxylating)(NADP+)